MNIIFECEWIYKQSGWELQGKDRSHSPVARVVGTCCSVFYPRPCLMACKSDEDGKAKVIAYLRDAGVLVEGSANAELLDACRTLVSIVEQLIPEESVRGVADVVLTQGRDAIAKAEGGQ